MSYLSVLRTELGTGLENENPEKVAFMESQDGFGQKDP